MEPVEFINAVSNLGDERLTSSNFNWIFWTLIAFNFIAIAYIKSMNPTYLGTLFRTGLYNRQLYQNPQEDLRLNSAGSVVLTVTYFNCIALIISSFVAGSAVYLPVLILVVAGIIVLIKFVAIRTLGILTETKDGLTEHWLNHLIYFQLSGLILTPLLFFTHFLPQTIQPKIMIAMAVLVAVMILAREVQSFIRAIRLRLSLVYIILYLCTLELIPLVVTIKALVK